MKGITLFLAATLLSGCGGGGGSPQKVPDDPKLAAIKESISKTTGEGKTVIEKVKGMKPEVNDQVSAKTLTEIIDDYSNKSGYSLTSIGWEASQKKPLPQESVGRWKVIFHYQDYQKQYSSAEWEYNPTTNKVYPFELKNAPTFWTGIGGDKDQPKPGKAGKK